jgi:hypothetical protein
MTTSDSNTPWPIGSALNRVINTLDSLWVRTAWNGTFVNGHTYNITFCSTGTY